MFERFRESGLKLKPSKCNFFRTEINYLGHTVSAKGMEPSVDGIKAIVEMALPRTYTGIRQFLGATGYFHRFIKGYANITKPLNGLLSGTYSKLKGCFVQLLPAAVVAFQELKLKCITAPMLTFADFHKPFLLETDASGDGLDDVLSQKQEDGRYHPVTYASRGLKGGELRYHSSKFLALKWVITEQFREYLQYQPFCIKTDNNPLMYVMSTPNLDAVGHHWVAFLAGFNFTTEYLRGADNKVADALSRVGDRLELDTDSVCKLLSHSNDPAVLRAKTDDPRLMQKHARQEQEIIL